MSMDENIIKSLADSIKRVIETMTMTTVVISPPFKKTAKGNYQGLTGVIGLVGENSNGTLLISFEETTIFFLLKNMLGEEFTSVTDDVLDAVGEFSNILCGELKRRLSEYGYAIGMATPLVIQGDITNIRDRVTRETYVFPCLTEGGPFVVETNLAKVK